MRRKGAGGEADVGRIYVAMAVAALAGLIGGTAWFVFGQRPDDRFAACREGAVAGGAGAIGGPLDLIDETGAPVTDREIVTGPTLIYFGYTFCPDVCPVDAARNAEAVDLLEQRGIMATPVFISVDPARDTPEVLAEFTDMLHPRMVGLTGTEAQVQAASQAYRTYFRINDPQDDYYLIDHSTFTYLVLPEVGFVDFFRQEVTAQQMADRVACFVEAV
jgi:protein SCO1